MSKNQGFRYTGIALKNEGFPEGGWHPSDFCRKTLSKMLVQNVMLRVNRTDSGSTGLKWTS